MINLARQLDIPVEERRVSLAEFHSADEVRSGGAPLGLRRALPHVSNVLAALCAFVPGLYDGNDGRADAGGAD